MIFLVEIRKIRLRIQRREHDGKIFFDLSAIQRFKAVSDLFDRRIQRASFPCQRGAGFRYRQAKRVQEMTKSDGFPFFTKKM